MSDLGATVILEVRKSLLGVFKNLQGVAQLVEQGQPLPAFDCHCPLMTLPLAFKTQLDTIPSPWAYLQSDAERRAVWQQRLGTQTQPRVGLVWSGSPGHSNDRNRSMRLEELLPHLPAGFDYICLHKEVRPMDQAALERSGIRFFGEQLHDYSDTAALTDLMDLVITVDTASPIWPVPWANRSGCCCPICPTGAGCCTAPTAPGTTRPASTARTKTGSGRRCWSGWRVICGGRWGG